MKNRGFVYVWRDAKSKKSYVGSHWGEPSDTYVCSSTWMRNAHRARPADFKRRIVDWVYLEEVRTRFPGLAGPNRRDLLRRARFELLMVEQRWLYMIPESKLGTSKNQQAKTARYYNVTRQTDKLWHTSYGDKAYLSARERISAGVRAKWENPDFRERVIRNSSLGRVKYYQTPAGVAQRKRLSERMRGVQWWAGREHTAATRAQMSSTRASYYADPANRQKHSERMLHPDTVAKMSAERKGRVWWTDGARSTQAQECPGEGWQRGRQRLTGGNS